MRRPVALGWPAPNMVDLLLLLISGSFSRFLKLRVEGSCLFVSCRLFLLNLRIGLFDVLDSSNSDFVLGLAFSDQINEGSLPGECKCI